MLLTTMGEFWDSCVVSKKYCMVSLVMLRCSIQVHDTQVSSVGQNIMLLLSEAAIFDCSELEDGMKRHGTHG